MAEEDSAGQDGMVRATVEPQRRLISQSVPACSLLTGRLNTTDPTLVSWKTRQRRRRGRARETSAEEEGDK